MKLISFFIFYLSVSVLCAGRYVDSTPFSEAAMNEIRGENPVAKAACYVQDAGEKRYHGSGVFVQYESNTFVITAAHNGELFL